MFLGENTIPPLHNFFQVPREEAADVPAVLLRVGPRAAGDPGPGQRLALHPGAPAQHLRQHQVAALRRQRLQPHTGGRLVGGREHSGQSPPTIRLIPDLFVLVLIANIDQNNFIQYYFTIRTLVIVKLYIHFRIQFAVNPVVLTSHKWISVVSF